MPYDPDRHHRRSIRLPEYDYAGPGVYFVTICTEERIPLFGGVVAGDVALNEYGRVVAEEWLRSAEIRREIELDAFVVMPNHIHGLVIFTPPEPDPATTLVGAHGGAPTAGGAPHRAADGERAHRRAPLHRPPRSLGSFVAGFKVATTKRINARRGTPGETVWQRNYHERIVRSENALARIYNYIMTNPLRWEIDTENPARRGDDGFDLWLELTSRPTDSRVG